MALTLKERQEFLAQPHVAALGINTSPDAPPLVIPVWYYYTEGEDSLWIMTGTNSVKARHIRAHENFSVMVERIEPTVRYVSVRGRLLSAEDGTREQLHRMASRYLPAEKVDDYVEWDWTTNGPYTVFHLALEKWFSLDMGAV